MFLVQVCDIIDLLVLSSWHLFKRSHISMRFLFISHNAMRTLRWRHCMLFCLLITWFYTIKKNKWKVRDWKVRNNPFCQCIAVCSNFLRLKITHTIKVPVLSNKGEASCSRKQWGPLMGLGPTTSTLRVRHATHCAMQPLIHTAMWNKIKDQNFTYYVVILIEETDYDKIQKIRRKDK